MKQSLLCIVYLTLSCAFLPSAFARSTGVQGVCPKPIVADIVHDFFLYGVGNEKTVVVGPNGSVMANRMGIAYGPTSVPYWNGTWSCNVSVAEATELFELRLSSEFRTTSYIRTESGSLDSILATLTKDYGGSLNSYSNGYIITRSGNAPADSDLYTLTRVF